MNRLPTDIIRTRELIKHCAFGFDRLTIWFDHPEPDFNLAFLQTACGDAALTTGEMPYHAQWKSQLTLLQPAPSALKYLVKSIGSHVDLMITDIEIACDFIVTNRSAAREVRDWFLAHIWFPHGRSPVACEETTFYFARRTDAHGNKRGRNLVIYADRSSKLPGSHQGRPCVHLEHRLCGSEILRGAGISGLGDLLALKHRKYWIEHLRLMRMPSKTNLGRWLYPDRAEVSGTALRKRADAFLSEHLLGTAFVLQNALRAYPGLMRQLKPIDTSVLFPQPPRD